MGNRDQGTLDDPRQKLLPEVLGGETPRGKQGQRTPKRMNRASGSAIRGSGLVLPALGTPYTLVLVEARTALVGDIPLPRGHMQDISHASQSMGHAGREVCVPVTMRWPEDGAKSCRERGVFGPQQESWEAGMQTGTYSAQYLSRAPALGVNSLTHHGGLHRRRSVSPAWQYGP